MNWNLLTCAFTHHVSYAPAEPEVRARLRTTTPSGEAWQCLRCATFVPGPPAASGPAAAAPRVRRDDELRSVLILRFFAVERFVRAIIFGFIAYGVWRFKYSRYTIQREFNREYPEVRDLLHELGYNVNGSGLVGLIRHTFHAGPAHADLGGYRRGRLHGAGGPRSDRLVGAQTLGRILRHGGDLRGHPV
ncbi:MAG: hypothetical protein ACRDMI_01185 [Streptosporangiaceae bacterium]